MTNLDMMHDIEISGVKPFNVLGLEALIQGLCVMWRCEYGGCPLHREDGRHCSDCRKEIRKWLMKEAA